MTGKILTQATRAEMSPGTPAAEVRVDEGLIRALLAEQHPDLAGLDLRLGGEGWDNFTWRLGEAMTVRMPRRAIAAELLAVEQRWLPEVAPHLPLKTPAPLRLGKPGAGYPWIWTIAPWLDGLDADLCEPDAGQGAVLAEFMRALHRPAPADAPVSEVRGVPLSDRREMAEMRLAAIAGHLGQDAPLAREIWERGLAADRDGGRVWLHGDLHARNVLVSDGRLVAAIDWGDMCAGDSASDLASVWMLLPDASARAEAMAAYGASAATWDRARAWAVLFSSFLIDTGRVDHPRHLAMGEKTLARLFADG